MYLFKEAAVLSAYIDKLRAQNRRIGFIPTMGALHRGHTSLIESAHTAGDIAVCSIFVNPSQFNDLSDLVKYPRTPEADIEMLALAGCDILFMPDTTEVYPKEKTKLPALDFGTLDKVMEGLFRPGHFNGVAEVVYRLIQIVHPDRLFMGQKDFQQLSIVRSMLEQTKSPVELVMCPTVREEDGLAMSSRNVRLSPPARLKASLISRTLAFAVSAAGSTSPQMIKETALMKLKAAGFDVEYFEIADGHTLQPLEDLKDHPFVMVCTAAWLDGIRLIDNMIVREEEEMEIL